MILKNWIHKTQAEEVVDEMLEGLQGSKRIRGLEWLEELQQPRRYICHQSKNRKDLTTNIQVETLGTLTKISTTALVNSGCTSSAISHAFIEQHNIPTRATAMPITVYNADG